MKTYEGYASSPDGWNVDFTLELEDDGRFSYSEGRTDYTNASLSGGAEGTWRRGDGVIVFLTTRIDPPIFFPWELRREMSAAVRGEDLDFGRGWTLWPKKIPIKEIPVRNDSVRPKTLVLEPWGTRCTLAPGEGVRVVTQHDFWVGMFDQVEYGDDEIVYRGWVGTWATIVPEPQPPDSPPAPPAPPRAPVADAGQPSAGPSVKQTVNSPVEPPTPPTPGARFVPRKPSRELAALLRKWVDGLEGGNMIARLCREEDAIPLGGNQFEVWALRTDGQVLCIDHESSAQRAEPETDSEVAYGWIAAGAQTHPELSELLPPDRLQS